MLLESLLADPRVHRAASPMRFAEDTTDVIYAEDEEVFRETAVRELLKVGFLRRVSALSAARVENAERTGPTKDGQPSSPHQTYEGIQQKSVW